MARKASGASELDDALATLANQGDGLRAGRVFGHAGEKRIAAFKAVNKASALQHVEDAIDGDRCEAFALICEALDQIVGANRLVAPRNVAEHLLPKRRPPDPKLQAPRFRAAKRVADADTVIMVAGRKRDELLSDHSFGVMLFRI